MANKQLMLWHRFLPPPSAVEFIQSEPCVSVCVSTLAAEPFDLWPQFSVWNLTLARPGLQVKVKGQGHQVKFHFVVIWVTWPMMWRHVTSLYDVHLWRQMTSHYDVMWHHITNRGAKGLEIVCRGRCMNAQAFSLAVDISLSQNNEKFHNKLDLWKVKLFTDWDAPHWIPVMTACCKIGHIAQKKF